MRIKISPLLCRLGIVKVKVKVKVGFFYSATYSSNAATSRAVQSRKWQLIGKSQWCCSANCGHPLHALTYIGPAACS